MRMLLAGLCYHEIILAKAAHMYGRPDGCTGAAAQRRPSARVLHAPKQGRDGGAAFASEWIGNRWRQPRLDVVVI